MSSVNVNLHGLEHSHQLVQRLLSILAYEFIFLIYFTYLLFKIPYIKLSILYYISLKYQIFLIF